MKIEHGFDTVYATSFYFSLLMCVLLTTPMQVCRWSSKARCSSSPPHAAAYPTRREAVPGTLRKLNLGSNALTGMIPSSVGHLRGLVALNLSSNKLSGDVPLGSLAYAKDLRQVILERKVEIFMRGSSFRGTEGRQRAVLFTCFFGGIQFLSGTFLSSFYLLSSISTRVLSFHLHD